MNVFKILYYIAYFLHALLVITRAANEEKCLPNYYKQVMTYTNYNFTVVVYRRKYLKQRILYSSGHPCSFNPAIIINQEAHMINGNMEREKEQKKKTSCSEITSFFKKDTPRPTGM